MSITLIETLKLYDMFKDCHIYILPNGLLRKRSALFHQQIKKFNGNVLSTTTSSFPTHIVVDDSLLVDYKKLKLALKSAKLSLDNVNCDIVGTLWISRCIKERKLLDTTDFKYNNKRKCENSDEKVELPAKVPRSELSAKVMDVGECNSDFQNNESKTNDLAINELVIREFQKLADAYRARGDQWRTYAYDKALNSLKSYPNPLTDTNHLKLLPHVSNKMIDKISEIIECGYCTKADIISNDEQTKVLELFSKIWGAGPSTAQMWYHQGYRTLDDLQSSASLTKQQEIGLKYYNEILEKIPRLEVAEIVEVVKKAVHSIDTTLRVVPCGSYRRGKQFCGDIDVVVIAGNVNGVLHKVLLKLKSDCFLVDDLCVGKDESGTKYLGLCKLPGKNKVRRLDIFIVSEENSACALLHFTGSAYFNRAIRVHALKMEMKLTHRNLFQNGSVIRTPTEESIFEHLKLQYKAPCDRSVL